VIALVACEDALYRIEIGEEVHADELDERDEDGSLVRTRPVELVPDWASSSLVDVDAVGSTVLLLLGRRPPLLVSHDGGMTWNERGGGLPAGRAVAVGENPDQVLYAGRNRLYVSTDGGRFWRAVGVELPEIRDVSWE
jgi:hypothetical protein